MKIAIGSDHAGFPLKEEIESFLDEMRHEVVDVGTHEPVSCDYTDFAHEAVRLLVHGDVERVILICGTGLGMSMVANRYHGVRAALCTNIYLARMSRLHNDANLLALGGRVTGIGLAKEIVKVWLETPFEGGRHTRRIQKIEPTG